MREPFIMPYHHLSGAKIGFFTIESKQINDYLLKSGKKNEIVTK